MAKGNKLNKVRFELGSETRAWIFSNHPEFKDSGLSLPRLRNKLWQKLYRTPDVDFITEVVTLEARFRKAEENNKLAAVNKALRKLAKDNPGIIVGVEQPEERVVVETPKPVAKAQPVKKISKPVTRQSKTQTDSEFPELPEFLDNLPVNIDRDTGSNDETADYDDFNPNVPSRQNYLEKLLY